MKSEHFLGLKHFGLFKDSLCLVEGVIAPVF